jgi:hypothetical protein
MKIRSAMTLKIEVKYSNHAKTLLGRLNIMAMKRRKTVTAKIIKVSTRKYVSQAGLTPYGLWNSVFCPIIDDNREKRCL